jgi:hypothetical protein
VPLREAGFLPGGDALDQAGELPHAVVVKGAGVTDRVRHHRRVPTLAQPGDEPRDRCLARLGLLLSRACLENRPLPIPAADREPREVLAAGGACERAGVLQGAGAGPRHSYLLPGRPLFVRGFATPIPSART